MKIKIYISKTVEQHLVIYKNNISGLECIAADLMCSRKILSYLGLRFKHSAYQLLGRYLFPIKSMKSMETDILLSLGLGPRTATGLLTIRSDACIAQYYSFQICIKKDRNIILSIRKTGF